MQTTRRFINPEINGLIKKGRYKNALDILDMNLTEHLEAGDAAKVELVTLDQLGVAVEMNEVELVKEIRIMRLELFSKTGQRMKAREELNRLKRVYNKTELAKIKALTGFSDDVNTEAFPLLDQIDTYYIIDHVSKNNTGIINAVMRKITLFEEEWNYRSAMIISSYNQDIETIISHHKFFSNSRINTGVRVLNVYDYFQKTEAPNLPTVEHPRKHEGVDYRLISQDIYMAYENGKAIRREHFTHPGSRLRMVQHLNEQGGVIQTDLYDKKGYLSRTQNDKPDKSRSEIYYTTEGKVCIKSEYEFKKEKHEITSIALLNSDGETILQGKKEADLCGHFLSETASKSDRMCLFVSESGVDNKAMTHVTQKNAIKTAVVHSVFLEDPYNLKSKPQFFFKDLVYYQGHFDGVAFLTKTEADDFIKIYGKPQRVFVTPNFYPNPINRVDFENRNTKKAVIVARYDPIKKLSDAIEIFKLVVEKVPDAILEMYGYGFPMEKERLETLVKKYKLENNVFVNGSTDSANEVYSSGVAFMMTSSMEGMPLTLIESICNGCPAFSYDIKYGPSDIIRNGKTGFLLPRNNIKAFAKQLVSYFEDSTLQQQMCENAYEDARRFSKEVYMENWYKFMEGSHAQKALKGGQSL